MMEKVNLMHDYLVDYGIATQEEISLVTDLNGYNEDTLRDIYYVRQGSYDIEDLLFEDDYEEF